MWAVIGRFTGNLLLLLGLSICVHGQALFAHDNGYDLIVSQAFRLAQQGQTQAHASKGTSAQTRLIMQAGFLMSDDLDTAWLKYSGQRGSTFDYLTMSYHIYTVNTSEGLNDFGGFLKYDSMWFCNPSSRGIRKFFDCTLSYNTDNTINKYSYGRSGAYLLPGTLWFKYNSFGHFASTTKANYDTATAINDTTYRDIYVYDNSNRCIAINTEGKNNGAWFPSAYQTRSFNTLGQLEDVYVNLLNSSNYFHLIFSYDNAGRISTMLTLSSTGSKKDSFAYDSNNLLIARDQHAVSGSGIGDLIYVERRHLNNSGLPDSISISQGSGSWGPWDSVYCIQSYNSYGDPTQKICYVRGTMQVRGNVRWFYELIPPASISNTEVVNNTDLKLFPNPSKEYLQLTSQRLRLGYGCRFSLANTVGQTLMSGFLNDRRSISTSNLIPGIYILSVTDKEGKTGVANFVKQ